MGTPPSFLIGFDEHRHRLAVQAPAALTVAYVSFYAASHRQKGVGRTKPVGLRVFIRPVPWGISYTCHNVTLRAPFSGTKIKIE